MSTEFTFMKRVPLMLLKSRTAITVFSAALFLGLFLFLLSEVNTRAQSLHEARVEVRKSAIASDAAAQFRSYTNKQPDLFADTEKLVPSVREGSIALPYIRAAAQEPLKGNARIELGGVGNAASAGGGIEPITFTVQGPVNSAKIKELLQNLSEVPILLVITDVRVSNIRIEDGTVDLVLSGNFFVRS